MMSVTLVRPAIEATTFCTDTLVAPSNIALSIVRFAKPAQMFALQIAAKLLQMASEN